jgi:hypothetical protein
MPEGMRSWGVPKTPADSTTSFSARIVRRSPSRTYSTPTARSPSTTTRVTSASVTTRSSGEPATGRTYDRQAVARRPPRIVARAKLAPRLSPAL